MARILTALEDLLRSMDVELEGKRASHVSLTADIDRLERQRGVVLELREAQV